jgi:hypothetical protein
VIPRCWIEDRRRRVIHIDALPTMTKNWQRGLARQRPANGAHRSDSGACLDARSGGGKAEAHHSATDLLGHPSIDHEARSEEHDGDLQRADRTSTNSSELMVLGKKERGLIFGSERKVLRTKKGAETLSTSNSRHRATRGGARLQPRKKGRGELGLRLGWF